jgi:hypothetical protein
MLCVKSIAPPSAICYLHCFHGNLHEVLIAGVVEKEIGSPFEQFDTARRGFALQLFAFWQTIS